MADNVEVTRKETAMWLLERIVPGTGVNNVITAFEVDGRLDRAVLARSLAAVVDRHDTLRTTFTTDDATLTKQVLEPGEAAVTVSDIPDIPVTGAGRDADLTAFSAAPFALDGGPLVRAGVWAGDEADVCCVVVHHLVFDAMSTTILLTELLAAYEAGGVAAPGRVAPLAERPADERSIAYWRKNLEGLAPSESGLWCAKHAGATSSLLAETIHHTLSSQARDAVRRLQKQLRASEAVVLLAAYYVLLAQHGAGDDMVIGTPVNVRDQSSMNAIGYHANLLPLRVKLDPAADFRAVVKKTRGTFLEAISNAAVPLEQVSPAVLGDTPSTWRSSFFRHLFNYVPGTVGTSATLGGMPVRHVMAENGYSRFDLEFFIMPGAEETTVRACYCVDAFDGGDVALLLERYDALLAELGRDELSATDHPVTELPRWGATDRAVLTPGPAVTSAFDTVPGTVLDKVHDVVAARPDAVAVEEVARVVTYGQLWSAALDARDLVAARNATTVALIAPRSADLAAAWLGCWLAGAACVLLDPAQPPADLATRVTDADAGMVLIAPGLPVPGGVPIPPITGTLRSGAPEVSPDAPAYLEYPLDAGEPAAVVVGHQALAAAVAEVTADATVSLWLSSAATGASLLEVLAALTSGGHVVISPDRARTDGQVLGDLLDRHQVGLVQAPAVVWRHVIEQAGARLAGRTVLTTADTRIAEQLRAAGAVVRNGYTTPGAAGYATPGTAFVTEPGTTHELGIGVRGELCVAGAAVAAGYHNRPALTEERFGEHPVHGRFHRTGELARWRPDGTLELAGPLSATVTAGGQRVHLSHVEAVLGAHPDVDAVVAIGAGAEVTAFVESRKPDVADRLREHARAALPLTPALVVLDVLPLTLASTVDRAALAGFAASALAQAGAEPPDETTATLVTIWAELLDRPGLHADSNFFASGGHSLLGAQLVQRVKTGLGLPVALADLFANPTPRELAEHIQNAVWDDDLDDLEDDFDDDFDDED